MQMFTRLPGLRGLPSFLIVLLALLSGCASQPPATNTPEEPEAEKAPSHKLVIAAVGDIMLDGSAREIMDREGYDHAFAATREWLSNADIAIGNLEGPLTRRGTRAPDKQFLFRSPPAKVAEALSKAGFDVVALANNHTLDYGADGLTDTILALQEKKIQFSGAGNDISEARKATIVERNGLKVAFLSYSLTFPEEFWATKKRAGTAFGHRQHIEADVRAARAVADIVAVSFHWGQESKTELRPYQVGLGRAAINAGAQLVIGHHPHILQAVERYKDGVILYSLGNFAFGSYSRKARHSAVAEIEFDREKLVRVRMRPINVLNVDVLFQPTPLVGEQADVVIKELQELSSARKTSLVNHDGAALLELDRAPVLASEIK